MTNHHFYDTHCHLDLFDDFDNTVNEIERNHIYTIAVTNLPILYSKLKNRINSKFIRPALGFHPELLFQYQKYIPDMWKLLPDAKYIGEVGLDFKIGKDYKSLQVSFFEELISRCNNLGGKILTVHSRLSADETISIIGPNFNSKVILHWYSGSLTSMKTAIDNGYFFSVNYSMLNSDSGRRIIKMIPSDRMLIESDAPFIKIQNQTFRPSDLKSILIALSIIKGIGIDNLYFLLWNNFKKLVGN
jgi:TatD DNase family protein